MTGAVVGLLREALSERVDTDPSHLDDARADKSGHAAPGRPIAIVLSLIHISEPTRLGMISYAVFCLKKKK